MDDELSTRERRLSPMLIVHSGQGKGKSTAAFGMALRAWQQGWPVHVFQFIKSGKWRTGEQAAFAALDEAHRSTGVGGPVSWEIMGAGWTWLRATRDVEADQQARDGFARVAELLASGEPGMFVLDEFNHVLARGWLAVDEAVDVFDRRRPGQHIVVTGRGAPQALIDAADLVTEMTKIKHPFDSGQRGQAGIEW